MIKIIFQAIGTVAKLGAVKNWKTTGIGIVGAICMVIFDQMNAGVTDWQTYVKAALIAIAGILVKDADTTGGAIQVVSEETIAVANPEGRECPSISKEPCDKKGGKS